MHGLHSNIPCPSGTFVLVSNGFPAREGLRLHTGWGRQQSRSVSCSWGRKAAAQRLPPPPYNKLKFPELPFSVKFALGAGVAAGACLIVLAVCLRLSRRLRRPYRLRTDAGKRSPQEIESEIWHVITFIQDEVMRPIDRMLLGEPFEADFQTFPLLPTVLVIGNHSSGKSTFINTVVGKVVQETGVAPTDEGFTVLERASNGQTDVMEDGPTMLACHRNRAFSDLRRFGDVFLSQLRRKLVVVPDNGAMPYGMQIVDSPGMIDVTGRANERGYDFTQAVRWWAARSGLILLMFDPEKPGTTAESLQALVHALSGLENKLLLVLNKVDQLEKAEDFARAYGTLGWSLAKVLQKRDLPSIYAICNEGFEGRTRESGTVAFPLSQFSQRREALVDEVRRVEEKHYDNAVTTLERTLRDLHMAASILKVIRREFVVRSFLYTSVALVLVVVFTAAAVLGHQRWLFPLDKLIIGYATSVSFVIAARANYARRRRQMQSAVNGLDTAFHKRYARQLAKGKGDDVYSCWARVRPKVAAILRETRNISELRTPSRWQLDRIEMCLRKDVWHLRQLARTLRALKIATLDSKENKNIC